jgi:hypothetical protein
MIETDLASLELLEGDFKSGTFLDRCEFPGIMAVHFVIHGKLGAGVSSTSSIDALGKVTFDDSIYEAATDFIEHRRVHSRKACGRARAVT